MQKKTHVYETIIEILEYQMMKLRQRSTEKQELEDGLMTKEKHSKEVGSSSPIKAKLSKLVITKSNWTHINWIRFWNQFQAEMDKSNLPSKFFFTYKKCWNQKYTFS